MFFAEMKYRKMLENQLGELRLNLENNYKDLAHTELDRLIAMTEDLHSQGHISEKTYARYSKIGRDYQESLKDYHH